MVETHTLMHSVLLGGTSSTQQLASEWNLPLVQRGPFGGSCALAFSFSSRQGCLLMAAMTDSVTVSGSTWANLLELLGDSV